MTYQLLLYEISVSDTLVVTRFVLGLKEELSAAAEIQLPSTVSEAATYALVQEDILSRTRTTRTPYTKNQFQKSEIRVSTPPAGDLWKARQLKEYRRTNGLCFSCGEKFTPGHVCSKPAQGATLQAMQTKQESVLSDELLDAVEAQETAMAETQLLVKALSGADHPKTIRLRALIGNQVVLILLQRIRVVPQALDYPLNVKVANGESWKCEAEVLSLNWWVQGLTFEYDLKVTDVGGYDMILGMDWLEQWGEMTCYWKEKWIKFHYQGTLTKLQGVLSPVNTEL